MSILTTYLRTPLGPIYQNRRFKTRKDIRMNKISTLIQTPLRMSKNMQRIHSTLFTVPMITLSHMYKLNL